MNRTDDAGPSPADADVVQTAATWLIRREAGLDAAEAAEFARWRDADPRHARALSQVEATQRLLQRLPASPAAAALLAEADGLVRQRRDNSSSLRWWRPAVALAAAACLGLAVWLAWPARSGSSREVYATAAGHRESVRLPDGSTLVLNGDSEVRVAFGRAERRVQLSRGEAHFFVAKDVSRPFLVEAGSVTIRAVGTAFNVRREANALEVLVTEGKVQVTRVAAGVDAANATGPAPIFLVSGESVHIDLLSSAVAVAAEAPTPVEKLLRPAPRLVFTNTPLSEVVALFNRYNQVQMEIAEPDLGLRAVGGNFDADNAESFIALLDRSGDVLIERVSPTHVRLHKAR